MENIKIINKENGQVLRPRDLMTIRRMGMELPQMQAFSDGIPCDISTQEIIGIMDEALAALQKNAEEKTFTMGLHTLFMIAVFVARDDGCQCAIDKAYAEYESDYQKYYARFIKEKPEVEDIRAICCASDDYIVTRRADKLFKIVIYHTFSDSADKTKPFPKAYEDIVNAVHPRIMHYVKRISDGLDVKGFFDRYDVLECCPEKDYRTVISAVFLGHLKSRRITMLNKGIADELAREFINTLDSSFEYMSDMYSKLGQNDDMESLYREACVVLRKIGDMYEKKEGKSSEKLIRDISTMLQINCDSSEDITELNSNSALFFDAADRMMDAGLLTKQQHRETGYMIMGYGLRLDLAGMDSPISARTITADDVAYACYSAIAQCYEIYKNGYRIPKIVTLQSWIISRAYAIAGARYAKNFSDYLESIDRNILNFEKNDEGDNKEKNDTLKDMEKLKESFAAKLADKDAAILDLYRENLALTKKLDEQKEKCRKAEEQLHQLREKNTETDECMPNTPAAEQMLKQINDSGKRILMIGGNERKNRIINEMIPEMTCTGDNDKFNPVLFLNSDYIFFNPQVASHHLFKKVQSLSARFGKEFEYINASNNEAIIRTIYEAMFTKNE